MIITLVSFTRYFGMPFKFSYNFTDYYITVEYYCNGRKNDWLQGNEAMIRKLMKFSVHTTHRENQSPTRSHRLHRNCIFCVCMSSFHVPAYPCRFHRIHRYHTTNTVKYDVKGHEGHSAYLFTLDARPAPFWMLARFFPPFVP